MKTLFLALVLFAAPRFSEAAACLNREANPSGVLAQMLSKMNARWSSTATYYGAGFHGKRTASGAQFCRQGLTAAVKQRDSGRLRSFIQVTNSGTGASVCVKITDTGGLPRADLDLSEEAFKRIASIGQGRVEVDIKPVASCPGWQAVSC